MESASQQAGKRADSRNREISQRRMNMAKQDFKQMSEEILQDIGGMENLLKINH